MTLPRYGEYRDSGVEWLGEVPGHWKVLPLKRDLAFLTSGSRGWAEHYADDGALFIRIGNLTRDSIRLDLTDLQKVEVPSGTEGERTRVSTGDVLFSITAYLGSVAVVPTELEPAYVSQHVALARLRQRYFIPAWVGYVTLSLIGKTYLETQGYGGTKVQLSLDDVANLIMTVPPLPEQTAIAAFLDRETGKIDALVAEQEKLIALLKEKRQAVISHAVTKGLDPTAPMKESGIEWLGEVPGHWEVVPVKRSIELATSGPRGWSEMIADTGAIFFQSQNIGRAMDVVLNDVSRVTPPDDADSERARLQDDDVVVCITGARTGAIAHIQSLNEAAYVNQHVCLLRPISEYTRGRYLSYCLSSSVGQEQLLVAMYGLKQGLGLDQVRNVLVCQPPLDEQMVVVAYINRETTKLDALTAEAQRAISLLKERRSALISAAVTGKIDVRGLVQVQEAA